MYDIELTPQKGGDIPEWRDRRNKKQEETEKKTIIKDHKKKTIRKIRRAKRDGKKNTESEKKQTGSPNVAKDRPGRQKHFRL